MNQGKTDLISVAPLSVLIIAVNVVMYFVLAYYAKNLGNIDGLTLIRMGSSMRELTWEGEWIRLIAPSFLHVHMLHIGLNMMSLYRLGPSAEEYFGSSNFGSIYLVSGICGIAFSQIFGGHNAAGASASIFGLLGAQIVAQVFQVPVLKYAWRNKIVRELCYLVLFYFALGWSGMMGPIDNWAHLGGFIFGAIFAAVFELWRTHRRLGPGLLCCALLAAAAVVCAARWSVFNPYYHLHLALVAREEKKPEAEVEKHFTEAREWGAKWGREKQITVLVKANALGEWSIKDARRAGYRALGEHFEKYADEILQQP